MNKIQQHIEGQKCINMYCKNCEMKKVCSTPQRGPKRLAERYSSKKAMREAFECYCLKYTTIHKEEK